MSYSSPVAELLSLGDCRNFREWPNYLELGIGPQHVPELISMATDEQLNWGDPESLEVWAPIHAWRALGQLRATEAIQPLLRLFHELEESDWAGEELPVVYGMIGPSAIPELSAYLADRAHGLWPRITAANSLEKIGEADPAARPAAIAAISHQLERLKGNDPTLNGFLISYLIDLQALEAAPLIERAFDADCVDLTVAGDWEDTQVELGLKAERETPRSYNPLLPFLGLAGNNGSHKSKRVDQAAAKTKAKRKQAKVSRKKNRKRK